MGIFLRNDFLKLAASFQVAMLIETDIAAFIISQRIFTSDKTTFVKIIKNGWCIFGRTPIPSTAYPTYNHVVLTAVVGPMHCKSDGHNKNSILVQL